MQYMIIKLWKNSNDDFLDHKKTMSREPTTDAGNT